MIPYALYNRYPHPFPYPIPFRIELKQNKLEQMLL